MGFWHDIFSKKVKNDQNVNVEEKTDEKTVENESTNICNTVEIKPEKIIYTSCNPNTLKRDIKLLECNYSVKEITPVNMFPKTEHIECVALLIHK